MRYIRFSIFFFMLPFLVIVSSSPSLIFSVFALGPNGQGLYILSKWFGLCALLFLFLQPITIYYPNIFSDGNYRAHKINALFTLCCSVLHVFFFFSAASVRSEKLAFNLFVIDFSTYYHSMLSVGLVGFVCLIASVLVGRYERKSRLQKSHRVIGLCSFVVLIHAFSIGSETRSQFFLIFIFVSLGVMLMAYFLKILKYMRKRDDQVV